MLGMFIITINVLERMAVSVLSDEVECVPDRDTLDTFTLTKHKAVERIDEAQQVTVSLYAKIRNSKSYTRPNLEGMVWRDVRCELCFCLVCGYSKAFGYRFVLAGYRLVATLSLMVTSGSLV
ncbi:hypothetical protein SARC_14794 [Sphaeroforma arctica JP610]|uniref:Uncharacterized protein n=1 Tax=Sphaeroforma arctica JP610 TaxID=667725 RepID=A0A0L0F7X1_9EUKA|nr:hypothetical protein SARC_14794 [Sphaeroforma arctica JP610]KNC72646.1 hypothetical protein SARC_14794 [Sphaeroforma arctica JP610]|eukprot:XP_014146548.1 hypothetical protein SARC_14794 [Sphaeroforma arctica JP610]